MVRPVDAAPIFAREQPEDAAGPRVFTPPGAPLTSPGDGTDSPGTGRPPPLPEPPAQLSQLAQALDAPVPAVNLRFLTHRPDMLGLPAAHLVYGLRALGRWIRRSKAEPGELERWLGTLLGVDPSDIKRPTAVSSAAGAPAVRASQLGLADALATQVEDELASCGLYASLAADLHKALPYAALAQLQRASQSGSAWLAFTTYPEFCLKRGLGAAADPRFRAPVAKPDNLALARATVEALSPGLDPVSKEAVTQEVAIAVTPADMQGLLEFARSEVAAAWIHLQPTLRERADAIFQRRDVQQRLGERLRRVAVPGRALVLRAPR